MEPRTIKPALTIPAPVSAKWRKQRIDRRD